MIWLCVSNSAAAFPSGHTLLPVPPDRGHDPEHLNLVGYRAGEMAQSIQSLLYEDRSLNPSLSAGRQRRKVSGTHWVARLAQPANSKSVREHHFGNENKIGKSGMAVHAYDPSTRESETGRLW